jgi:hypothetical protein
MYRWNCFSTMATKPEQVDVAIGAGSLIAPAAFLVQWW